MDNKVKALMLCTRIGVFIYLTHTTALLFPRNYQFLLMLLQTAAKCLFQLYDLCRFWPCFFIAQQGGTPLGNYEAKHFLVTLSKASA